MQYLEKGPESAEHILPYNIISHLLSVILAGKVRKLPAVRSRSLESQKPALSIRSARIPEPISSLKHATLSILLRALSSAV